MTHYRYRWHDVDNDLELERLASQGWRVVHGINRIVMKESGQGWNYPAKELLLETEVAQ